MTETRVATFSFEFRASDTRGLGAVMDAIERAKVAYEAALGDGITLTTKVETHEQNRDRKDREARRDAEMAAAVQRDFEQGTGAFYSPTCMDCIKGQCTTQKRQQHARDFVAARR